MNREMLMLVEAIAREKNVEHDVVFGAVEAALAQATKKLMQSDKDHPGVGSIVRVFQGHAQLGREISPAWMSIKSCKPWAG